jgi:hypothetical protein
VTRARARVQRRHKCSEADGKSLVLGNRSVECLYGHARENGRAVVEPSERKQVSCWESAEEWSVGYVYLVWCVLFVCVDRLCCV